MCWRTAERVASASTGAKVVAWIVAKAMTLEVCIMGCSCKLGMILANLVLGSRWFVEEELDAVVAKCNLLVLLIVHFCVRALPSFQLRLGIHWSNDLGPCHGNSKMVFFPFGPPFLFGLSGSGLRDCICLRGWTCYHGWSCLRGQIYLRVGLYRPCSCGAWFHVTPRRRY